MSVPSGLPETRRKSNDVWSITLYAGASPFRLAPHPRASHPVLTRDAVTDVPARFVADPFMIRSGGGWHMFFEVFNDATSKGEIGHAVSADGLAWEYGGIVLAEPFHLSYPHVFAWEGEHYMVPEALWPGRVSLYRAAAFPRGWQPAGTLIEGRFADPTLTRHGGAWWLFACPEPSRCDTLRLFRAGDLGGPWKEHPASPVVTGDRRRARPGGRVVAWEGGLVRFAQDCVPAYGSAVRAFTIHELSAAAYREEEVPGSPVLEGTGQGWNATGMHHVDAHPLADGSWLACVDGYRLEGPPA